MAHRDSGAGATGNSLVSLLVKIKKKKGFEFHLVFLFYLFLERGKVGIFERSCLCGCVLFLERMRELENGWLFWAAVHPYYIADLINKQTICFLFLNESSFFLIKYNRDVNPI